MSINTQELQACLDQLVAGDRERGVQLAAYHRGALVANLCAGMIHPNGPAVTPETLFPVFSVSKGIAATVIHRLVATGILSYDQAIVDVWPAFGAHGKEGITLRHALDHTAGLQNMPENLRIEELGDWEKMCAAIADLTPVSAPGERQAYHAMTFGWIIGEAAARATGRSFPELLEEEIRRPLGITSLYMGIPHDVASPVAILEEASPSQTSSPEIPPYACPLHRMMNRLDMQRACIPATNGMMSAEAIARHYAGLTPGGADGVELLPPERVREFLAPFEHRSSTQRAFGYHPRWSAKKPGTLGHDGFGGATGFADPGNDFALGFTRNRFDHPPDVSLIDRLHELCVA
jgi:CubicO group peptidase (beta-lactamase class C family)